LIINFLACPRVSSLNLLEKAYGVSFWKKSLIENSSTVKKQRVCLKQGAAERRKFKRFQFPKETLRGSRIE
jgi:hypothetical protein